MLGGKVGEKWKFEKKICREVRRIYAFIFTSVQSEMNKDYAEMTDRNRKNHEKRLEVEADHAGTNIIGFGQHK